MKGRRLTYLFITTMLYTIRATKTDADKCDCTKYLSTVAPGLPHSRFTTFTAEQTEFNNSRTITSQGETTTHKTPANSETTTVSMKPTNMSMETNTPKMSTTLTTTAITTPTTTPITTPTTIPSTTPITTPKTTTKSTPIKTPTTASNSTPITTPTITPKSTPIKTPTTTSNSTPITTPTIAPKSTPIKTPTTTSNSTPITTPTITPKSTPIKTPTTASNSTPITTPTITPKSTPIKTPTTASNSTPITTPTITTKSTPIKTPTTASNSTPITTPTITPKSTPIKTPTTTSNSTPITTPTITPKSTPIKTPKTASNSTPITTPTITPKSTPIKAPTTASNSTPITTPKTTPKSTTTTPTPTTTPTTPTTPITKSTKVNTGDTNHKRHNKSDHRKARAASIAKNTTDDTTTHSFYSSTTTENTTTVNCELLCKERYNITELVTNSTLSTPTVTISTPKVKINTPKVTTKLVTSTVNPNSVPNWGAISINVDLVLVVDKEYDPSLEERTSFLYIQYEGKFREKLIPIYKNIPGFKDIVINGFSNGSTKCNYSVVLNSNLVSKKNINETLNDVISKEEKIYNITIYNSHVDKNKTTKALKESLHDAKQKFSKPLCTLYGDKVCRFDHKCSIGTDQFQEPYCVYMCNVKPNKDMCGEHGDCYVNIHGKTKCRCKDDPLYVFHGDKCDIKQEKLLLSTSYIIAIAAGGGGAVILIIFAIMICLCCKWNKAKKASQFYQHRNGKTPRDKDSVAYNDDRGIQMENSRIENVHMGGYEHDNPSYIVESAPSSDGGSMMYDKGRYYRVVKDPEIGSDTLIYQPSNLNTPIMRDSLVSRDDVPGSDHPLRTHYDYIDTDAVYKIKRPNVRSNSYDRSGHPRTVL